MKFWKEPEEGEYCLRYHIIELYYIAKWKINKIYEKFYWKLIIYLIDNKYMKCSNCRLEENSYLFGVFNEDDECVVCGKYVFD